MKRVALVVLLCLPTVARPQDSDTVIFKKSPNNYTILSEVTDPQERDTFTQLYSATDPKQRHELAEHFLAAYPQSWLLAQVYDASARASLDLGNVSQSIDEGRVSLRLLPENPTLLVLMANAEAQANRLDDAVTDARDALEYLDVFMPPGAYSEQQWSTLKPQLKASAYFALGRALFVKSLSNAGGASLPVARDALDHAVAWNSQDPEIFYLRALVEIKADDKDRAIRDLAFVARSSNSLRIQAAANLHRLTNEAPPPDERPIIDEQLREEKTSSSHSAAIREGYAGSAVCRSCHPREYSTWSHTGMAKMLRPFKPENIIGDFSSGSIFRDDSGKPIVRMGVASRPYFEFRAANGAWQRFAVDYTIGSKWQQAYATRAPDGTLHVIPIEYSALRKEWVNYWKIIDPPGTKRDVVSDFPSLEPATNYEENCAVCHTSQLRAALNAASPAQHAEFREPGIDCEMCHGPSAWHVKQMRSGKLEKSGLMEPPVDFRKIDNRSGVRVCAQCHRQSAVREMGEAGEMNYSTANATYLAQTSMRPYDAFERRAFYKDGRFRETTFIVEAFTRSACYRKGTAQCASCHSPHTPGFETNQTSLKFGKDSDEMCLTCHNQMRNRIAEHTHHATTSEGSRCVSCHMPRIVNALLFKARSHQIEIPRADLTQRFGQADSPNACLICHSEKDANWAAAKLEQWRD
ncbi:MAG TPA: cytochrome c3 family protein [Bryobacteraceae bacterium]|jgi:predicted CXXCH cytochrome family protein|nr:cytochrome c3 family protein [Bryobacteraceae bacterium]